MPVSPITNSTTSGSDANAFNALTSEEFMRIIMTELSQQDPLKPNDTNQMVQELSSIRSIQSDIELVKKLDAVVSQNQLASAGALIGNFVVGLNSSGVRVGGQVISVSRTSDGPVLNLDDGSRLPFDNIELMQMPITDDPPADTPDDTNGDNNNNNNDNGTPVDDQTE